MNPRPLRTRWRMLAAAAAAAMAATASAQETERRVVLELEAGAAATRIEDSLEAFEAVAYIVPLRAGQTLQVALTSSNLAQVFDIHAPGLKKPVFAGGDAGNVAQLHAKSGGEFLIRAYLLRFAARDGQSARYTLEVKIAP